MRLDGAQGKKQVWCPHIWTWGLLKANLLYWRKYFWHCWDFSAQPHSFGTSIVIRHLRNCAPLLHPWFQDTGFKYSEKYYQKLLFHDRSPFAKLDYTSRQDYSKIACSCHLHVDAILSAHPVRGASHIQHCTYQVVATDVSHVCGIFTHLSQHLYMCFLFVIFTLLFLL